MPLCCEHYYWTRTDLCWVRLIFSFNYVIKIASNDLFFHLDKSLPLLKLSIFRFLASSTEEVDSGSPEVADFHGKLINFLPTLEQRRPASHPPLPAASLAFSSISVENLVRFVPDSGNSQVLERGYEQLCELSHAATKALDAFNRIWTVNFLSRASNL